MYLILVSGPPGAGKSTLVRGLAQQVPENLKFVWLDKDQIDEPFSPNNRGDVYTREIEPKALDALVHLAESNLSIGNNVVLDAPWTHILIHSPKWRERITHLVHQVACRLIVFECVISDDLLKERIQKRGLKRDQVKLSQAGWENFKKTDCLGSKIPMEHIELDLSLKPSEVVQEALQHLYQSR